MKRFLLILMTILLIPITASAATHQAVFLDVTNGDQMFIDSTGGNPSYSQGVNMVLETIGIPNPGSNTPALITLPSAHQPIVTDLGNNVYSWFDVSIALAPGSTLSTTEPNILMIEFDIYNGSEWYWTDFHFEFYGKTGSDLDENNPLSIAMLGASNSGVFENPFEYSAGSYSVLDFWTSGDGLANGLATKFMLTFDLDDAGEAFWKDGVFIRQIATTSAVPVPGALILLGSGLLYLVGIRRK